MVDPEVSFWLISDGQRSGDPVHFDLIDSSESCIAPYLAQRHGIENQDERLLAISGALEGLANAAADLSANE